MHRYPRWVEQFYTALLVLVVVAVAWFSVTIDSVCAEIARSLPVLYEWFGNEALELNRVAE